MAHFAEVDADNIVLRVIVVNNEVLFVEDDSESEHKGIDFLEKLTGHRNWIQTSYNNNFRKRYANIGMKYYADIDAFGPASGPHPSWIFDSDEVDFIPPIPAPEEGSWVWSEEDLNWISIGGE